MKSALYEWETVNRNGTPVENSYAALRHRHGDRRRCYGVLLDEAQQAETTAERESKVRHLLALQSSPDDPSRFAQMFVQAMTNEATFTFEGDYLTIPPSPPPQSRYCTH